MPTLNEEYDLYEFDKNDYLYVELLFKRNKTFKSSKKVTQNIYFILIFWNFLKFGYNKNGFTGI